MNKLVGILLVIHNEIDNLSLLLNSLKKQTFKNFKIYFVDNNSTDGSIDFAKELNKELSLNIKFLPQQANTGFAGGNNIAAAEAEYDGCNYLFVLNNDMELDKSCIEELIKLAESDKKIGVAGPILFLWNYDKVKNNIQFYGAKTNFKKYEVHDNNSNKIFEDIKDTLPELLYVNLVPGGATFIPIELYRKIGLWDERYFMYGDEIDFSKRVIDAGYKLVVSYKAKVWHNHKILSGNKRRYYIEYYLIGRNKYVYYYKYRMYGWIIPGLLNDLVKLPSKLIWFRKVCDWKLGVYYIKGVLAGLQNHSGKPDFL